MREETAPGMWLTRRANDLHPSPRAARRVHHPQRATATQEGPLCTTTSVPPACTSLRDVSGTEIRTGYLTPSQSFLSAFSRFCRSCSVLPIRRYNHASPTVARTSSSSNTLQCHSYRLLDPPTSRHCEPVACCCRHTALLARRDAPVDTPHRQVIPQQDQTGHRRGCAKGRRQQE